MNYQTPRGTYDILPEEMNAWHDVEDVIKEVTRVYRYQEIRTPSDAIHIINAYCKHSFPVLIIIIICNLSAE